DPRAPRDLPAQLTTGCPLQATVPDPAGACRIAWRPSRSRICAMWAWRNTRSPKLQSKSTTDARVRTARRSVFTDGRSINTISVLMLRAFADHCEPCLRLVPRKQCAIALRRGWTQRTLVPHALEPIEECLVS